MSNAAKDSYDYIDLLAKVDKTYAEISDEVRLQISELSVNLPRNLGMRLARRAGLGEQPIGPRPYDPERGDERRNIHARLSGRGENMVVEKELQRRHRVSLWRDPTLSGSKKTAAEISLLALAEKLAKDEDTISVLHEGQLQRIGRGTQIAYNCLQDVAVVASDVPDVEDNVPYNSTFFLFGEFFEKDRIENILQDLHDRHLNGYVVMLLDPSESEFDIPDNVELFSPKGKATLQGLTRLVFSKSASMKEQWFKQLNAHLEWLEDTCRKNRFELILQRTDEPLDKGLRQILGSEFPSFSTTIPQLRGIK